MRDEISQLLIKFFEKYGRQFDQADLEQFDELWKRFYEIQPSQFINKNKLQFAEGNVIKYVCRHKLKGKKEDIKKAKHYLDMILHRDYD